MRRLTMRPSLLFSLPLLLAGMIASAGHASSQYRPMAPTNQIILAQGMLGSIDNCSARRIEGRFGPEQDWQFSFDLQGGTGQGHRSSDRNLNPIYGKMHYICKDNQIFIKLDGYQDGIGPVMCLFEGSFSQETVFGRYMCDLSSTEDNQRSRWQGTVIR